MEEDGPSVITHAPTQRVSPIWRWLILCSLITQLVLTAVEAIQSSRGYTGGLDFYGHPICAEICVILWLVTTPFLLFVSPFFFGRMAALAIPSWVVALILLVWNAMPRFY